MSKIKTLTKTEEMDAIQSALDAACLEIQRAIGQETGDIAAMFFSGGRGDDFARLMSEYLTFEYSNK